MSKNKKELSTKSLSVVDTLDDGNIYLEVGNNSTLITKLGDSKKNGQFKPYTSSVSDFIPVFYVYKVSIDDLPSNFESVSQFIDAIESQVDINEYVENWVDLGSEELSKFVSKAISKTASKIVHLGINSETDLFNRFFTKMTVYTDKKYENVIYKNSSFDIENSSVSEDAPLDVKNHMNDILYQLGREDRNFEVGDIEIDPTMLQYLDGMVNYDLNKLNHFRGKSVILVTDYFNNGEYIANTYRVLKQNDIEVLAVFSLFQYSTK